MSSAPSKRREQTHDTHKTRRPGAARTHSGPLAQYEEADLLALQRAVPTPYLARPADILAVQRMVGNRAVISLLAGGGRARQRGEGAEEEVMQGRVLASTIPSAGQPSAEKFDDRIYSNHGQRKADIEQAATPRPRALHCGGVSEQPGNAVGEVGQTGLVTRIGGRPRRASNYAPVDVRRPVCQIVRGEGVYNRPETAGFLRVAIRHGLCGASGTGAVIQRNGGGKDVVPTPTHAISEMKLLEIEFALMDRYPAKVGMIDWLHKSRIAKLLLLRKISKRPEHRWQLEWARWRGWERLVYEQQLYMICGRTPKGGWDLDLGPKVGDLLQRLVKEQGAPIPGYPVMSEILKTFVAFVGFPVGL